MLLSFVFCEIRKQHETGPTRYRDWWDGRWRKALEEVRQQHGVGASGDHMGGLLGHHC